jgi:hypothetical protein
LWKIQIVYVKLTYITAMVVQNQLAVFTFNFKSNTNLIYNSFFKNCIDCDNFGIYVFVISRKLLVSILSNYNPSSVFIRCLFCSFSGRYCRRYSRKTRWFGVNWKAELISSQILGPGWSCMLKYNLAFKSVLTFFEINYLKWKKYTISHYPTA